MIDIQYWASVWFSNNRFRLHKIGHHVPLQVLPLVLSDRKLSKKPTGLIEILGILKWYIQIKSMWTAFYRTTQHGLHPFTCSSAWLWFKISARLLWLVQSKTHTLRFLDLRANSICSHFFISYSDTTQSLTDPRLQVDNKSSLAWYSSPPETPNIYYKVCIHFVVVLGRREWHYFPKWRA